MRPAFRPSYWQNYPPPFYPGSSGQYPVPGWGVRPVMAGPSRVGVGALGVTRGATSTISKVAGSKVGLKVAGAKVVSTDALPQRVIDAEKPPVPAYVWWLAGAFAVGGVVAFASSRMKRRKR